MDELPFGSPLESLVGNGYSFVSTGTSRVVVEEGSSLINDKLSDKPSLVSEYFHSPLVTNNSSLTTDRSSPATDGSSLATDVSSLPTDGSLLATDGIALIADTDVSSVVTDEATLTTDVATLPTDGVSLTTEGIALVADDCRLFDDDSTSTFLIDSSFLLNSDSDVIVYLDHFDPNFTSNL